jgi:membrane protease YdiL (CAAX protease family)
MKAAQTPMNGIAAQIRAMWPLLLSIGVAPALSLLMVQHAGCSARMLVGVTAMNALLLLLIGPVIEELVFRWGLHRALRSRAKRLWPAAATGKWVGRGLARESVNQLGVSLLPNLITAAAFVSLHAINGHRAWAMLFFPALAIGLVYELTDNWAACAALHAWFNSCAIAACALNN